MRLGKPLVFWGYSKLYQESNIDANWPGLRIVRENVILSGKTYFFEITWKLIEAWSRTVISENFDSKKFIFKLLTLLSIPEALQNDPVKQIFSWNFICMISSLLKSAIFDRNWHFLTYDEDFEAFESSNGKYFRNFSPFSVVLEVFRDFLEIFLRFFVIKNEIFESHFQDFWYQ